MKSYILLSIFFGTAYLASGQQALSNVGTEKPPLPNPITRRVTELTPWTIVFRSARQYASPQAASSRPKTTSIIKSKRIYHIVESSSNSPSVDKWSIGGMLVTFFPNSDKWSISTSDLNFSQTDFPELSWLSKDIYEGVQKVNGSDAYIFKTQYTLTDENGKPETFLKTAAVDVATQWPVYSTDGVNVQTYQYGTPVSTPLSVPSKVTAVIAKQIEFSSPGRR